MTVSNSTCENGSKSLDMQTATEKATERKGPDVKASIATKDNPFKRLGGIFIPLLPGFVIAGLCAGFASLLAQFMPEYANFPFWHAVHSILSLVNTSFTTYLSAWIGFSAAKCFGCSQICGGMIGMTTCLDGINRLSAIIGLYNVDNPLASVLRTGSGGVMTVIFGVWILSRVEGFLHRHMNKTLDVVLTPFIAFITCLLPCIFIFMPVFGLISNALCNALGFLTANESLAIRLLSGYVCAALFLPANLFGLQFAFIALYAIQLEATGSITLYPVLAMAGASQVGAGFSVMLKAKGLGNENLHATAAGGILPGLMGIGSALLYGVTVPYSKVFLTTCIGAGFGGAFIVATKVGCTGWGPSGLLALPLMTAGAGSPTASMLNYLLGLAIACTAGFVMTSLFVCSEDLK